MPVAILRLHSQLSWKRRYACGGSSHDSSKAIQVIVFLTSQNLASIALPIVIRDAQLVWWLLHAYLCTDSTYCIILARPSLALEEVDAEDPLPSSVTWWGKCCSLEVSAASSYCERSRRICCLLHFQVLGSPPYCTDVCSLMHAWPYSDIPDKGADHVSNCKMKTQDACIGGLTIFLKRVMILPGIRLCMAAAAFMRLWRS